MTIHEDFKPVQLDYDRSIGKKTLFSEFPPATTDASCEDEFFIRPIDTAPTLHRVFVCGWQSPSKSVAGYWWWHEDAVVDGAAIVRPHATHWFPIITPDFPSGPTILAKHGVLS